jgi:hypothetical protein
MRCRAASLMASPSAVPGVGPSVLSACFAAIQKRPPASAMMIAAPIHCLSPRRIVNQIMVHP